MEKDASRTEDDRRIDWMLGTLVRVIHSGKQALDAVMLEMGRMVAEIGGVKPYAITDPTDEVLH